MHFSLNTASLESPPSYSALSYTWGSADPNDDLTPDYTKTITVNGCTISITENLWGALKTIHSGEGYLWVDALCINQQDMVRRSAQIHQGLPEFVSGPTLASARKIKTSRKPTPLFKSQNAGHYTL